MGIGKWVKKGAVTFMVGMKGMEEQALSQTGGDVSKTIPVGQNTLMRDLKEGRVTDQVKQFRKHHYEVLRESEKYKAKWGKDGDFKLLTEEEMKQSRTADGDPYDNYEVEIDIDNQPRSKSLFEFEEKDLVRPIKVNRNVDSRVKLEEVCRKLHVRDIDGTRKLLDFYVEQGDPKNRLANMECQNLINNPTITNFNNFTNVGFTTTGGNAMVFEYKVLAFDKVVKYNGDYIVKMFAEVTNKGTWIGEKYMIID